MARPSIRAGGGFASVVQSVRKALETGHPLDFLRRVRSRNACKTCALGSGGPRSG